MQPGDVLVIGPLDPVLPRPLRVRLGVAVTCAAGCLCVAVLLATFLSNQFGLASIGAPAWLADAVPFVNSGQPVVAVAPVQVSSVPAGARILLHNRDLGTTPASLKVGPGDVLELSKAGYVDSFVRVTGSGMDVPLWRSDPVVQVVRPPIPGASVQSAAFLPDGRVALEVQVPPSRDRQAWAYDPAQARLERLDNAVAPGAMPSAAAVAPDGVHIASIEKLDGLDGGIADQLTIAGADGVRQPLSPEPVGERMLDLSWSPKGDGLLLVSRQQLPGGSRFVIRWVGADGASRELVELPAEPVAGSWVWAPDGEAVAFLVHSSVTALVTLDVRTGELRYLDDLSGDGLPGSGAIAPATWQLSGALLYAAPDSSGSSVPALFEVEPGRTDAHRVGDVEPVWAPMVRPDGILLTLARADNDALVLRPVDPAGHALAEQRIGVRVPGAYSARWDLSRQQLLILRAAIGNALDVLLLRFSVDDPAGATAEPHP